MTTCTVTIRDYYGPGKDHVAQFVTKTETEAFYLAVDVTCTWVPGCDSW